MVGQFEFLTYCVATQKIQAAHHLERTNMDKFEEIGKRLDEELTRLRKFVEEDFAPEAEKRSATFLREVSEKLTEAAGWLEKRRAAREKESSKVSS